MRGASIEKSTILYYGNPAGYLTDGKAVVDPLFQTEEMTAFLSRQKDIAEVKWTSGSSSTRLCWTDTSRPWP